MPYFYLHPFKPQYFFQEESLKDSWLLKLFQPYSCKGRVSWWLFRRVSAYRVFFSRTDISDFIPEVKIRSLVGERAVLAFNLGTPGPSQKLTCLGRDKGSYFFCKISSTPQAKDLLRNEAAVLKKLSSLDFVPKVQVFVEDGNLLFLKTNVLEGERIGSMDLNKELLSCLLKISKAQRTSSKSRIDSHRYVFAHGDFCPWNMLSDGGTIRVYDWEMTGYFPIGYDLFTFIFQPSMLIKNHVDYHKIVERNYGFVVLYFNQFNVSDWNSYLVHYCRIKLSQTDVGENPRLLFNFQKLLKFASDRKDI